jgi:hypothetical protein
MQIHSVGIDLGKTTFHLVALGAAGKLRREARVKIAWCATQAMVPGTFVVVYPLPIWSTA